MTPIKCFLLKPTDVEARYLRRYRSSLAAGAKCSSSRDYHCAAVRVEDGPAHEGPIENGAGDFAGDPRWPKSCACGYEFTDDDPRQVFPLRLYRDATGRVFSIHTTEFPGIDRAPAGAMWFADWMPHLKGPDGRCLVVRCPASPDGSGVSDWMVDGPSTNAPGWTRTGEPPNVTASPSIFVRAPDGFHGWLRDGVLHGV